MLLLETSSLLLWPVARLTIVGHSTFEQKEQKECVCVYDPLLSFRGGIPFFFLTHSAPPPPPPPPPSDYAFSLARWQVFLPKASVTRKKNGIHQHLNFNFLARSRPLRTAWLTPLANAKSVGCFAVCYSSCPFIRQFNRNLPPRGMLYILCRTKVVFACFTSFPSKSMTLQEGQLAQGTAFTFKTVNYCVGNLNIAMPGWETKKDPRSTIHLMDSNNNNLDVPF